MADAIDDTLTIDDSKKDWVSSILRAKSLLPHGTTQIQRVPMILKERTDLEKYYVPTAVSLGPYHRGRPSLQSTECLKPLYTDRLLESNHESILSLYESLAQMVQMLRAYYEDDVDPLSDDEFIRMMLLDGCFILYFIDQMFKYFGTETLGLKSHQIMFVQQDMLLLENQIPFRVLTEVMKFVPHESWDVKIIRFIDDYSLVEESWRRARSPKPDPIPTTVSHLLELLQIRLTKEKSVGILPYDKYTFGNVNGLIDVGIHFKPSKTRSLAHIKFSKCGFFANLQLPPITVDDSTKPILLNLVAYEMCSNASWVTSYIRLLDSLIDHSEDVMVLRKAGIIDNRLGSDTEVAKLFNEIGRDLVPNSFAFSDARFDIEKHCNSKRTTWNTLISQLKHEYIKSPWAFLALLGGLLALFLSSVQTYFSVWGNQNHCDSLCKYLKKHHLP